MVGGSDYWLWGLIMVNRLTAGLAFGESGGLMALRLDPRQAIQEEGIVCLHCGGTFRQLTNTHLKTHGTTPIEYKYHFGYNRGRALMCLALRHLYADRAMRSGLAARIRHRPIVSEPELRRRGGYRPKALEERLTQREVQLSARRRSVPGQP